MDNGAHYFKTDLQVHTPRDRSWKGERPTGPEDRRTYARDFVASCRAGGLAAVAITDHHDFAMVDYIREVAAAERGEEGEFLSPERRLVVFPGLELTLAVPCQALLILDADFPSDRLPSVLERLGIDAPDPGLDRHPEPRQLPGIDTLGQLHELLDRADWLRGAYAVFPNVTDSGNHSLMRSKMQQRYAEMPCVGGYVDGPVANKVGTGNARIFAGKEREWGSKRIAVFQTSDARDATFSWLGKHATWVKWAVPTAEALRQACLAQESRIAHAPPELPRLVITRLNVSNSKFMGRIDLELNPQCSAFIGGRGTGKSTCLEYLRWGLCDQQPNLQTDGDESSLADRRERLIADTLVPFDSNVEVHFLVNGVPHVVRRFTADGRVMLRIRAQAFAPATTEDVRSLLPIEAYSQRQLSTVGVRLEELTRFVEAPIRSTLDDLAAREARIAAAIRQNYGDVDRQRVLAAAVERDAFTITSLTQQAERLRTELADVSAADRECLNAKPLHDQAEQTVTGWLRKLEQSEAETDRSAAVLAKLRLDLRAPAEGSPERDTLLQLEQEVREALAAAEHTVRTAAEALRARTAEGARVTALARGWRSAHDDFRGRYGAAKDRAAEHASGLEELERLDARCQALQTSVEMQREELIAFGDAAARHADLLDEWRAVQTERSETIEQQCLALNELSGGQILASVQRGAGTRRLQERFRGATVGSNLRGNKIEGFLANVAGAEDPLAAWHAAMEELEARVVAGPEGAAVLGTPATALRAFSSGDLERIFDRLATSDVVELSLVSLDDHPSFKYRTKEDEYIDFDVASAGQQATALLQVLLNQGGSPLIIDQPEDDLDSQVILDIVDRIWDAKHKRQLVFSSHNANLVVNGDAELVVCCDYTTTGDHSAGRIRLEGAIDVPAVRDEITLVMEGGERAFRLRKDKYGF